MITVFAVALIVLIGFVFIGLTGLGFMGLVEGLAFMAECTTLYHFYFVLFSCFVGCSVVSFEFENGCPWQDQAACGRSVGPVYGNSKAESWRPVPHLDLRRYYTRHY